MAHTWGDARRMAEACESAGIQLTINHQLRFGKPYRKAKRLVDEGRVGDLVRVECTEATLYDNGTHSFDLANYFTDQTPVEWVLAGIDYTEENRLFGAHNENQAVAQWRYENGVYGLASTGRGESFVDGSFRLIGTDGVVRIGSDGELSYRRDGGSWTTVDTGSDRRYWPEQSTIRSGAELAARKLSTRLADRVAVPTYTQRAIADVIGALQSGAESELNADVALDADELIFAAWESSRRRGRVDLPLDIDDNPRVAMVESGELDPATGDGVASDGEVNGGEEREVPPLPVRLVRRAMRR
jgi:predicted dehydrogenase